MTELLYRFGDMASSQKVAALVMRISVITEPVSGEDLAGPVQALLHSFHDKFGEQVGFTARGNTTGRQRQVSLGKVTSRRTKEILDTVGQGGLEKYGVRFYGTDQTDFGRPLEPYASVAHEVAESERGLVYYARIDFALPDDDPKTGEFLTESDEILRQLPLRAGFQGYAFASSPVNSASSPNDLFPPAFQRYRNAIMTQWRASSSIFYYTPNATQALGDYSPGLLDMGWRTYVGAEFAARLDGRPDDAGVLVEHTGGTLVVTAGDRPSWGDVEAGDDNAAYRSAYRYLKPAFASRSWRRRYAPGALLPNAKDVSYQDDYLDRFDEADG